MKSDRRSVRIVPKDYRDYLVQLEWGELTFDAKLGNVSETGVCALVDVDFIEEDEDHELRGSILDRRTDERIEFECILRWSSEGEFQGQKVYFYGLQFKWNIKIPESLLTKGMEEQ
jgi:hypothetical protein